jgi:hypothetical protein
MTGWVNILFQPELKFIFRLISSSDILTYGRSQIDSIRIASVPRIQSIAIDWRRSLFPSARETASERFLPASRCKFTL